MLKSNNFNERLIFMARILIADDEVQILSVMTDVLEAAGYEVVGVGDGEAAIQMLKSQPFDLALVDVMMPKVDGYHVAMQVHSLPHPPHVVIVTSRNFEADRRALQAAGAAAFLPKPFSNRELLEVVSTLLDQKKGKKS